MANQFLTAEGLIIQRLSDILASQKEKAISLFQDLVPAGEAVDTSDNSTLGRLISLVAPSTADLWEAVQEVDSAFDPEKATGIALDKIVKYGGLERLGAQRATAQEILIGNAGVVIPYGSSIRGNSTNAIWKTRSPITLSASTSSGIYTTINTVTNSSVYSVTYGTSAGDQTLTYTSDSSATETEIADGLIAAAALAPHNVYIDVTRLPTTDPLYQANLLKIVKKDVAKIAAWSVTSKLTIEKCLRVVEVQAEIAGAITQEINTITTIATPVFGWDAAYNSSSAIGGSDLETDEELRLRFRNTKYERASNILEALYSALISVEGVTEVLIYENDTASPVTVDSITIPPHSFMPIVAGGDTAVLAKTIWENKPLGILSYQSSGVYSTIYDSQGFPHLIGVNAPSSTALYIGMNITINASVYPSDGDDQIKSNLIQYLETNFGIGDDIIFSRLYTPINSVVGHQVNALFIGSSPILMYANLAAFPVTGAASTMYGAVDTNKSYTWSGSAYVATPSLDHSNLVIPFNSLYATSTSNITIQTV